MRSLVAAAVLMSATLSFAQSAAEPFIPFQRLGGAYRLVNAMAFSPDGKTMYFALLHREVLAARGQSAAADAPEIALYEAAWDGAQWSEPKLLPFSGRWKDYEPAVSPDGSMMTFQSWRPRTPSEPPGNKDNFLWMVRRTSAGWSEPVALSAINGEKGTSYSTLTADGRIFFLRGDPQASGGENYNLYEARWNGTTFADAKPVPSASGPEGEGDPWVSPDGQYLIFTRFGADWNKTCDLYITFHNAGKWTAAVPLEGLNTPGPDYSPAVSPDGEWLYYRAGGRYVRRALAPVLADARKAAGL